MLPRTTNALREACYSRSSTSRAISLGMTILANNQYGSYLARHPDGTAAGATKRIRGLPSRPIAIGNRSPNHLLTSRPWHSARCGNVTPVSPFGNAAEGMRPMRWGTCRASLGNTKKQWQPARLPCRLPLPPISTPSPCSVQEMNTPAQEPQPGGARRGWAIARSFQQSLTTMSRSVLLQTFRRSPARTNSP